LGRCLRRKRNCGTPRGREHSDAPLDEIAQDRGQLLILPGDPAIFDRNIATVNEPVSASPLSAAA
jgi:hypothetical protein